MKKVRKTPRFKEIPHDYWRIIFDYVQFKQFPMYRGISKELLLLLPTDSFYYQKRMTEFRRVNDLCFVCGKAEFIASQKLVKCQHCKENVCEYCFEDCGHVCYSCIKKKGVGFKCVNGLKKCKLKGFVCCLYCDEVKIGSCIVCLNLKILCSNCCRGCYLCGKKMCKSHSIYDGESSGCVMYRCHICFD